MKTLVFDIWGDYGHFGVYYSTSSPLTFSAPPPITVLGIVGAILGLEKEDNEYLSVLNHSDVKIAVGIASPIKKINLCLNHIDTKRHHWLIYNRTQINTEMLKDPKYRVWFSCGNDSMYSQLKELLANGKSIYTISLGLSESLASFRYVGEDFLNAVTRNEAVKLHSLIPILAIKENGLIVEDGLTYQKERLPCAMNEKRIVTSYKEYLFSRNGQPVKANVECAYTGKYGNVVFTDMGKGIAFCY